MKIFWPRRPDVNGFSIENLARKYQERISNISSGLTSNESVNVRSLNSIDYSNKQNFRLYTSENKGHWANRDFSEYRNAS
tara:strand:+ start:1759 stop:1998 length:240 start_codon:yes stop_codon:yes gene_type:complete